MQPNVMQSLPLPLPLPFIAKIKSCQKDAKKVQLLHAYAAQAGLLQNNVSVGNALISMYAKCAALENAKEVFDTLRIRDVVTWTALIAGYVQHGCEDKALDQYEKMLLDGVCPNAYTYASVLKACANTKAIGKGIRVHSLIEVMDCVRSNPYICNSLVNLYAKCGQTVRSREVLNRNPVCDIVSWTALVAACIAEGLGEAALGFFKQMQLKSFHPNAISFTCILSACSSMKAIVEGIEFHAEIEKRGLLENDLVLGTTLVNMYAKCGMLDKAQEVFDRIPVRDIVVWTALIAGYEGSECSEEALQCFDQMQVEGYFPDSISLTCSLKACGSIGALDVGRQIHAKIAARGLISRDVPVGNALVGMYANCGLLLQAKKAFGYMTSRDVVSWTALIMGYAQLGQIDDALFFFERMIGEGTKPDAITFITVLNAFSHSGSIEKAETYFEAMSKVHGIVPTLKHHSCLLDLHGRAGQLKKAVAVANESPFNPSNVMWDTILGACQNLGDPKLGKHAFAQAVQTNDKGTACYVSMGNILVNT